MENVEELNKKIAEWCGFKWNSTFSIRTHGHYDTPNGQILFELPDFTTSLDACFEYIVPRVFAEFGRAALEELLDRWVEDILRGITSYDPKEIALALCRAVEKLIDGEKIKSQTNNRR